MQRKIKRLYKVELQVMTTAHLKLSNKVKNTNFQQEDTTLQDQERARKFLNLKETKMNKDKKI